MPSAKIDRLTISQALSVAGAAFSILCIQNGAGKHAYNLSNPLIQVPHVIEWNTAYQIDNVLCVNLVKISIFLFVLRIQNSRTVVYLIWAVMFIMSVVNVVTVAMLGSQCRPLAKLWNTTLPGVCSDKGQITKIGYGQGTVNILTDFFCTTTPIIVLWKVQISARLKVVICGLMSLGLIATASQIVRVITLGTLEAKDYSCTWPELLSTGITAKLTHRVQQTRSPRYSFPQFLIRIWG